MSVRKPRLYRHPDGLSVTIGFVGEEGTGVLLQRTPEEDEIFNEAADITRIREWCEAVAEVLGE